MSVYIKSEKAALFDDDFNCEATFEDQQYNIYPPRFPWSIAVDEDLIVIGSGTNDVFDGTSSMISNSCTRPHFPDLPAEIAP